MPVEELDAVVVEGVVVAFSTAMVRACNVAGVTTPVTGTSRSVWSFLRASVSSGVHSPSTAPVQ